MDSLIFVNRKQRSSSCQKCYSSKPKACTYCKLFLHLTLVLCYPQKSCSQCYKSTQKLLLIIWIQILQAEHYKLIAPPDEAVLLEKSELLSSRLEFTSFKAPPSPVDFML